MITVGLPLISSYTFTTTSGTYEYNLPANYIAMLRVSYNDNTLEETTMADMDTENLDWNDTIGIPTKYYIRISTTMVIGFNPTPIWSTHNVVSYYYDQGNDLSNDIDIPFNGFKQYYSFHPALSFCAASIGWTVLGNLDLSKRFYEEYIIFLQRIIDVKNLMPNYPARLRIEIGKESKQ